MPTVIAFHGLEPLYHEALLEASEQSGGLSWRYRLLQERLMPFMLRTACRHATRVMCLNSLERDYLVRRGWVTADRVDVVFHGVPPEFYLPERPSRQARTLLFVGQWLPMKGVEYLRDAFTELAHRHADLRLVCAGTLAPADEVLAGFPPVVRPRVTVIPRLERLALVDLYREADIMIAPSLYEGFGVALVEAMAARLPIVTTRVGVAADALTDGESALIIPTRHAQAIVGEVERLLADAGLRERLGEAAGDVAHALSRVRRGDRPGRPPDSRRPPPRLVTVRARSSRGRSPLSHHAELANQVRANGRRSIFFLETCHVGSLQSVQSRPLNIFAACASPLSCQANQATAIRPSNPPPGAP